MPPKKVGRKTNKKKGNKRSVSTAARTTATAPTPMPLFDDSATATATFTAPRSSDGTLDSPLTMPPEEYFRIINHYSYLLDAIVRKFGDRVRERHELNQEKLQRFRDAFERFQKLGMLKDDNDEVNELKYDLLAFSGGVIMEIDALDFLEEERRGLMPIDLTPEKTNQFLSIEDYFTAILETVVFIDYMERSISKSAQEVFEFDIDRTELHGFKHKLVRLQRLGKLEQHAEDAEVTQVKWDIRRWYNLMKSQCIEVISIERLHGIEN